MSETTVFSLDPRLAADSTSLLELELCAVRLMEDARYPWLVLVPRRPGVVEILDLSAADQVLLWDEVRLCAAAMRRAVNPEKLNVAALGNVVAQLHIHVIGRFKADDAWPRPVWGVHPAVPYEAAGRAALSEKLLRALGTGYGPEG